MESGYAVVVDIGKTLSKISLWSRDGQLLERATRPNEVIVADGVPRLDERGIAQFVVETLASFGDRPIEYIIPVAHGASIAAIKGDALCAPPIDYEAEPPAEVLQTYRKMRAPFEETGSPALPAGLNSAVQILWSELYGSGGGSEATLMPWAQYWAWFLSGVACSEITSLGCHSDLWNPARQGFSSLAIERGWADQFAPIRRADEVIGKLRPELATRTGLSPQVQVLAGLHDSNAALMAARGFDQIAQGESTILSTGTWFVAMRLAEEAPDLSSLPEQRDCLVNVDPFGRAVPSARFMGGREIECLIEIDTRRVDIKPDQQHLLDAVPRLLKQDAFILPTLAPGNGPFPDRVGGWVRRPEDWYERRAGACIYAAMVADTALDLIGSKARLLVEGRFAEAEVFVRALASLRSNTEVYVANAHNDVSFGALRLLNPDLRPQSSLRRIEPLDQNLKGYVKSWRAAQRMPV